MLKVFVMEPKKPNSAKRCCVRVRLSNGHTITAYVPGERNNLVEHSCVLVEGGGPPDLPGVKYRVIRGVRDASPGEGPSSTAREEMKNVTRKNARSRYGVKRSKQGV